MKTDFDFDLFALPEGFYASKLEDVVGRFHLGRSVTPSSKEAVTVVQRVVVKHGKGGALETSLTWVGSQVEGKEYEGLYPRFLSRIVADPVEAARMYVVIPLHYQAGA